ncbi:cell division cycle protein 27 homolog isoform X5 [Eurytemora carolleeae]|uniref:cell division cycle protein 27 homolog isoform X5 n=1 Tax=Eurytemora carolleeae TaxID=1294199 RepID=UPI000C77EBB3|nr:cell division cycle protein 27 homolog isoform X5 [Eurytemora carolleeae]|eukprot:XP_023328144.1 cell division cycle protein 27 homolog isoform X5 [Eurytemora affinis]
MLVQEPVETAIWHCLNHYAYNDATFLAERLFAETGSDECLYLVATCYYRAGKVDQAFHILQAQGLRTSSTKYLFAKCAVDLEKDFEAENILNGNLDPRRELNLDDFTSEFGDKSSFALQLLSGIYDRTERRNKAIDADKKSLRLNPFLWSSYEAVCNKGEFISPDKMFDLDHVDNFSYCQGVNPLVNLVNSNLEFKPESVPESQGLSPGIQQKIFQTLQQPQIPSTPQQMSATPQQLSATPQQILAPPQQILATPQQILSTPQQLTSTPHHPFSSAPQSFVDTPSFHPTPLSFSATPQQNATPMNIPTINVNDSSLNLGTPRQNLMETPLLYWNSVSTPMSGGVVGTHISGISLLNNISDLDLSKNCGNMPPPLRPKLKRFRTGGVGVGSGTYSPTFGTLECNQSPALPFGITARILEFSSPQIAILSPVITVVKRKPSLPVSPMPLSSRPSTPSAPVLSDETKLLKRVAMSAKPENQKPAVLVPSGGNVRTPQNTLPTRRSSRLFGSTQSVKENSSKNRISIKSPSRKSKPRQPREKQLSEMEKNERNKPGLENKNIKEKFLSNSEIKPEKPKCQENPLSFANINLEAAKIQRSSASGLMSLLRNLGRVYMEASKYNSREAIRLLEEIPDHHGKSSWALALRGKCHFELAEYKEAAELFRILRDQDPLRLEMMEYYSTALWHIQDDVELSALAQDLTQRNKMSAVSWCAAGNCFSHQKEHENAIKFFQRAVQVQPRFAYAYTLLGHEYVFVEELDKALVAFRTAVRLDSRHYNAWYGIGLTYYKQERFQLAEIYYRKALGINPYSPVLMCHVAVVQHALQKSDKALQTLNTAIKLAPKNALCKFERASILHSSERYADALQELNDLKDIVPKESPVYFLLGKVHNKLGNTHHALMHFSWAMDLDPKGANSQIKDALDPAHNRVGQESELEDELNSQDEMDSRNQNAIDHTGEDSVFGENYSGGAVDQPGTSMILNEKPSFSL